MIVNISEIAVSQNRRPIDSSKIKELADSIREIGLINPITITADKMLIAGNHRLEAYKLLGRTEIEANETSLSGLYAELAEIDENLIRNELHYTIRGEQFVRRKEIYEELHPDTKNGGDTRTKSFRSAPAFVEDTADKIGVSRRTIEQEIQIAQKLTPEAKEAVMKANIPKTEAIALARMNPEKQNAVVERINSGTAKNIADAQREVKREEIITRLESVEAVEVKAAQGVYDVIVIDPPWPMQKIERDVRPNQSEFDYPTMSELELSNLEIPAADSCHMWLWTTHKFMPMAFRLLNEWGFKYVCAFVWHKSGGFQPIGLPQYNCEFALYARKGTPEFIDTKAFSTCFQALRGAHSEKPEEFYDMVRRVTAGRRIDMFNRRTISGFDVWGKEAAHEDLGA